eukprot:Skav231719  [mRNA]  locus=scaffold2515:78776:83804:- [translate_table: standard]
MGGTPSITTFETTAVWLILELFVSCSKAIWLKAGTLVPSIVQIAPSHGVSKPGYYLGGPCGSIHDLHRHKGIATRERCTAANEQDQLLELQLRDSQDSVPANVEGMDWLRSLEEDSELTLTLRGKPPSLKSVKQLRPPNGLQCAWPSKGNSIFFLLRSSTDGSLVKSVNGYGPNRYQVWCGSRTVNDDLEKAFASYEHVFCFVMFRREMRGINMAEASLLQERTIIQSSDGSRKDKLKKGEESFSVDEYSMFKQDNKHLGSSGAGTYRQHMHGEMQDKKHLGLEHTVSICMAQPDETHFGL